ncbi:MAG: hypothetical protein FWE84_02150 [Firmicutes bacterium]|nr:hypothetical protein [Bacillota bacterium]
MEELNGIVGTVVQNDGISLAKVLGVTELWHTGCFMFRAKQDGVWIGIATKPVDELAHFIKVISIWLDEAE